MLPVRSVTPEWPTQSVRGADRGGRPYDVRMDAGDFHDLRVVGRRQLLADFPLTADGLRLPWRASWIIYVWLALTAAVGLAVPTAIGIWLAAPLIFPPLASSALMVASQSQRHNAHPRAVLLGHGCGAIAGLVIVYALDLRDQAGALDSPTPVHGVAALLSVILCILLMSVVGVVHAPALSTALMIGLGLIVGLFHILVLLVGAALLTLTLGPIHRIAGVRYPWWATGLASTVPIPSPDD